MKKILRVKRKKAGEADSYWEDFEFETDDDSASVAVALLTTPVIWEHSCLQKKCGACAMIINDIPRLACDTRLSELKGDVVTVEPLRKFPVIEDLMTDRTSIMNKQLEIAAWRKDPAAEGGENTAFESSMCLQCGLCLEVCPNYHAGGEFGGMSSMTSLVRIMSRASDSQKRELRVNYNRSVYRGCGKSLACRNICPAGIDMEQLLVKGNKAALWNRFDMD